MWCPTHEVRVAREKRDDVTVKIDARIYRQAKLVATSRGIPLAEYLSDLLRKPVRRDFQTLRKDLSEQEPDDP